MVSISTLETLGIIGAAVLGFYKLGGASGIGSKLGGGISSLFDSFGSSLSQDRSALDYNPGNNPLLVAGARIEEATSLDPNLAADRFVDPAGKYDPYNMKPTEVESTPQTRIPIITRVPIIENFPTTYASPGRVSGSPPIVNAPYVGHEVKQPQTPQQAQDVINQNPLSYIAINNRGLNSNRSTRYG